ncbi:MAG: tRNA (adenosine(37)-N6)-threonylcarbamoyltransferase complex ATPase subunit type 1 TsaE [Verrucomicrobiota bacterium]|nr:tRNA (adenosine(37)-N6)-threonylcarbamoyltransferase complex ATPase subunit type 1 TsaE [Verrucomicrobiota bacterium]
MNSALLNSEQIFISHSVSETEALGQSWGRIAKSGWVIGLNGDLGAGKTQLVKGLAHGLGITEKVHSPTFTLVNEYSGGRLPLFHLDLYRLQNRAEILRAGLEEYFFNPHGVAVIEWFERWIPEIHNPKFRIQNYSTGFRSVKIDSISETERRIIYEDFGA